MRVSLKNFIVPSIPLAVFLVISCSGIWMLSFEGGHSAAINLQHNTILEILQSIFLPKSFLLKLAGLIFTLLNAFLIAQINNRFTIIRTRTFLPIFIFLLLMGTWNQTHFAIGSQLSLTLFIAALFYFFNMSRDGKASEEAFMGSLFISVSSLMMNQLIFLIPICWIGFMIFQSLSLRTFLASIFGTLVPWIFYLGILYLVQGNINLASIFSFDFNFTIQFSSFSLAEIIYTISVAIIMIIGLFGLFSISNSDAIHTRNKLNFLVFLLVALSLLCFIFRNQIVSILPYIALVYAFLISYPLTLKLNNFYGILFIIFCTLNIAFVISKYFLI